MSDKDVEDFFRGICAYYRAYQEYYDDNSASECSSKKEQQEIKKEVERNDCNSQSDC